MEMNISYNHGNVSTFNITEETFETPVLKTVQDILLMTIIIIIMAAMGCTITIQEIWTHVKIPIGIVIGMVSQFITLPLCSFAISKAVDLKANTAVGMLILSCSPGGTMSNLFTYWSDGDVSLSIAMTTISTIVAFGMMPLNLYIYSSAWTIGEVVIPYLKIFKTLLFILVPVFIGMVIKRFLPKVAFIICKIGSIVGMLGIATSKVIQSILFPEMYESNWNVWFSAAFFPIVGLSSGFILAKIMRRDIKVCKAIAFETGSQNVALAMGVVFLTFPYHILAEATAFTQLYSIIMLIEYGGICLIYNIHQKFFSGKNETAENVSKEDSSKGNLPKEQINRYPTMWERHKEGDLQMKHIDKTQNSKSEKEAQQSFC